MSSPCWSLLHLLSSSPTQHEAPPGQHDLLHDDTVHRAPLPEPIQSTSSADEPLPHVNYESDGNPRNTLSHILTKRVSVGDSNDGVWPENSFPFRLFQFNFVFFFFEIVFFLSRLFFMYFPLCCLILINAFHLFETKKNPVLFHWCLILLFARSSPVFLIPAFLFDVEVFFFFLTSPQPAMKVEGLTLTVFHFISFDFISFHFIWFGLVWFGLINCIFLNLDLFFDLFSFLKFVFFSKI